MSLLPKLCPQLLFSQVVPTQTSPRFFQCASHQVHTILNTNVSLLYLLPLPSSPPSWGLACAHFLIVQLESSSLVPAAAPHLFSTLQSAIDHTPPSRLFLTPHPCSTFRTQVCHLYAPSAAGGGGDRFYSPKMAITTPPPTRTSPMEKWGLCSLPLNWGESLTVVGAPLSCFTNLS